MINGLDRINYDQLTGLVAVKATQNSTKTTKKKGKKKNNLI